MKGLIKVKNKMLWIVQKAIWKIQDRKGMSTIELLLILVVMISLVLIFKNQLTNLVNTIFRKITSQSSGI